MKASSLINHWLWTVVSILEKTYWFIWRNEQRYKFLSIGHDVFIGRHCYFTNNTIILKNDIYIGEGCRFQSTNSRIIVGNHVMFGPGVSIHGGNHRIDILGRYMKDIKLEEKLPENDMDVVISDDVWIGAHAIILKGVTIGEGSIIGAGSVIAKDVPPYTVAVGSKSQTRYDRWSKEAVQEHLRLLNQFNNQR